MLSILFVKNEQDYDLHTHENNEGLAHVINPLKYFTLTWANSERGVCADYYSASVSSAEDMIRLGLQFIEVVKTDTKTSPMNYLPGI